MRGQHPGGVHNRDMRQALGKVSVESTMTWIIFLRWQLLRFTKKISKMIKKTQLVSGYSDECQERC